VLLYPASEANSSPSFSGSTSKLAIPSLQVLVGNLNTVLRPLGSTFDWLLGLSGLVLLFLWKPLRRSLDFFALLAIFISGIVWFYGVSFFGLEDFRQFVAVGAFLVVLRAVGISVLVAVLVEVFNYRKLMPVHKYSVTLSTGIVVFVVMLSMFPNINASIENAYQHTLPDRRNDLTTWADKTLAAGKYIGTIDNHKTFDRNWGGYTGTTQFPIAAVAKLTDRSIEEWRAEGVVYAITDYDVYEQLQSSEEGQKRLLQMTPLKRFPPSPVYRGPSMSVFRLYPIQYKLDMMLGPIRVVGYDIDRNTIRPGDSITFTLYWQAVSPTDVAYKVFNHLVSANVVGEGQKSDIVAQIDDTPLTKEARSTNTWDDPGEILMSRSFALTINKDTSPGVYRLITGFYRADTGARLLSPNNQDYADIAVIAVAGNLISF